MNPISKLFVWIQKLKLRKQIKGRCDAERAARDSLTRAIRSLYDVAFYADDLDALNELSELICAAECGEHIEPYKLGNIA